MTVTNAAPLSVQLLASSETSTAHCSSCHHALIFDFVIGSTQPFLLVEDADFHKLIEGISGGKTPMCTETLMQHIDKVFQSMKGSITRKLHGIHTICTTADIWTAHHRSYLGVTGLSRRHWR